jgi:hypothetical protein
MRWKFNAREQLRQAGILEGVLLYIEKGDSEKIAPQTKDTLRKKREKRKSQADRLDRLRREILADDPFDMNEARVL